MSFPKDTVDRKLCVASPDACDGCYMLVAPENREQFSMELARVAGSEARQKVAAFLCRACARRLRSKGALGAKALEMDLEPFPPGTVDAKACRAHVLEHAQCWW